MLKRFRLRPNSVRDACQEGTDRCLKRRAPHSRRSGNGSSRASLIAGERDSLSYNEGENNVARNRTADTSEGLRERQDVATRRMQQRQRSRERSVSGSGNFDETGVVRAYDMVNIGDTVLEEQYIPQESLLDTEILGFLGAATDERHMITSESKNASNIAQQGDKSTKRSNLGIISGAVAAYSARQNRFEALDADETTGRRSTMHEPLEAQKQITLPPDLAAPRPRQSELKGPPARGTDHRFTREAKLEKIHELQEDNSILWNEKQELEAHLADMHRRLMDAAAEPSSGVTRHPPPLIPFASSSLSDNRYSDFTTQQTYGRIGASPIIQRTKPYEPPAHLTKQVSDGRLDVVEGQPPASSTTAATGKKSSEESKNAKKKRSLKRPRAKTTGESSSEPTTSSSELSHEQLAADLNKQLSTGRISAIRALSKALNHQKDKSKLDKAKYEAKKLEAEQLKTKLRRLEAERKEQRVKIMRMKIYLDASYDKIKDLEEEIVNLKQIKGTPSDEAEAKESKAMKAVERADADVQTDGDDLSEATKRKQAELEAEYEKKFGEDMRRMQNEIRAIIERNESLERRGLELEHRLEDLEKKKKKKNTAIGASESVTTFPSVNFDPTVSAGTASSSSSHGTLDTIEKMLEVLRLKRTGGLSEQRQTQEETKMSEPSPQSSATINSSASDSDVAAGGVSPTVKEEDRKPPATTEDTSKKPLP